MITKRLTVASALVLCAQVSLMACLHSSPAAAATVNVNTNGAVGLTGSNFPVGQASGSVLVTAIRSGGKKGALTVTYTTGNGTALSGQQYVAETGTLKWADGDGSSKTFTIAVKTSPVFTGQKWFVVKLAAGANTILGSHTNAMVTVTGGKSSGPTTPTGPTPTTVKSIKQWVSCSESIDESNQLASALSAAAGGSFVLQIDCPVRFHTGTANGRTINVGDGTVIKFVGAGELLTVGGGATALNIAHPKTVTLTDWNVTYL